MQASQRVTEDYGQLDETHKQYIEEVQKKNNVVFSTYRTKWDFKLRKWVRTYYWESK